MSIFFPFRCVISYEEDILIELAKQGDGTKPKFVVIDNVATNVSFANVS